MSKKRQAEWMRNYRITVIPSVIPTAPIELEAWEITNWASYKDGTISNCPDRRYRDAI